MCTAWLGLLSPILVTSATSGESQKYDDIRCKKDREEKLLRPVLHWTPCLENWEEHVSMHILHFFQALGPVGRHVWTLIWTRLNSRVWNQIWFSKKLPYLIISWLSTDCLGELKDKSGGRFCSDIIRFLTFTSCQCILRLQVLHMDFNQILYNWM